MYWAADLSEAATLHSMIKGAADTGYHLGAITGVGADSHTQNDFGLPLEYHYPVITAFDFTDNEGTVHYLLMFRDPSGSTGFTGDFHSGDSKWTDNSIAQVPYGIDPRTAGSEYGIFITSHQEL